MERRFSITLGILGINCGHHKWPFIPGVNIQRHFPTEDMDANDKLYKQTQVQRALEREVRKQKRECMMLDAAGDQEGFEEVSVKLKRTENKLKYYVKDTPGLHRRTDREQIIGFDKRLSAEAVAKNKKVQKEVALKIRNDKIKEELELGRKKPLPVIFKPVAKYVYVPLSIIIFILGLIYKGIG